MKATRIDIKNFRGIKDLTIEFDPRINVFIGENGSGKTAILDAIATILSPYSTREMTKSDVTNGESFSSVYLLCDTVDGVIERESTVSSIDGDEGVSADGEIIYDYSFNEFLEWFYEMQNTAGGAEKLEPVIYALKEFLPDFSDFYIAGDPPRMVAIKNGEKLDLRQVSLGEMSIIDMVGILAMRMVVDYPMPGNALTGSGVVLIDEIDMHMHPVWQRTIVPKFLEIFPYCQFIISTNSPHVVNHVRPESLFIIDRTDDGVVVRKTNESYGKNVDRVLEDIMGLKTTRPDDIADDLHSIFETIDAGEFDEARSMIVSLIDIIGIDPELVKAGVLAKRMEMIGK